MAETAFRPRATIGGVPLHAMLVPFPIAGFTGALLCDIAYLQSDGQVQWVNFAAWLLAFGEFFGVIAALFGLFDLLRTPRGARPTSAWLHFLGSATTLTLGLFNNFVHARDGWTSVVPTGLTLSVLTVIALIVTGFLGHRLAYVHQRGGNR
jgi:uncharacterized membrane protein